MSVGSEVLTRVSAVEFNNVENELHITAKWDLVQVSKVAQHLKNQLE